MATDKKIVLGIFLASGIGAFLTANSEGMQKLKYPLAGLSALTGLYLVFKK